MTQTPDTLIEQVPDITLTEGCPSCDGPLVIRAAPGGGRSFCGQCTWLARVHLRVRGERVELAFPTVADA